MPGFFLDELLRLLRDRLREVEIHQADAAVAGDQDVFRLEIQVHEAVFVHVLQADGHINEDLGDVLQQHRVVSCVEAPSGFPPRRIPSADRAAPRSCRARRSRLALSWSAILARISQPRRKRRRASEVEPQPFMHQSQRVGFPVPVGRQPDLGHAAAVDQLLEVKPPVRTPEQEPRPLSISLNC